MAKTKKKSNNTMWVVFIILFLLACLAWYFRTDILSFFGQQTGQITNIINNYETPGNLPVESTSCSNVNIGLEVLKYFGAANVQQLKDGCENSGGVYTSTSGEFSCHYPNGVTVQCDQPILGYAINLCDNLKATWTCSDVTKYVGCSCGGSAPTEPLNGFPPEQPPADTCGWKHYAYGDVCTGTCGTGSCVQIGTECTCGTTPQHGDGEVGTIFVSSTKWTGPMGNVDGADAKCDFLGDQAYPGRNSQWIAMVSTSEVDVKNRLFFDMAFYTIDGRLIASSKSDLFDGTIQNAINVNEKGQTVDTPVWTGSTASGTSIGTDCHSWSWVDSTGTIGQSTSVNGRWISSNAQECSGSYSIYCVRIPVLA